MSLTLITLRLYHGGVMKIGKKGYKGKPYHDGEVYEFLDVDIDRLSYFELTNSMKELGYELGQCVLYVKLPRILVPPSLEYGESGVGEGASQNNGPNASFDAALEPTHETQENASNPASNPAPAPAN
ncbi:hypothetical protein KY290_001156 [Solanum tuberosum]|uniref:PB1-like domain-containing protein n=1 Tax=Solanum tuberosum TaxID=4113 RepID=A0ABQ7WNB0_SOLTU|nr:hypothetical protein KY290_001156 [Solanum tuberosum]